VDGVVDPDAPTEGVVPERRPGAIRVRHADQLVLG
jgi:hypothetical protein